MLFSFLSQIFGRTLTAECPGKTAEYPGKTAELPGYPILHSPVACPTCACVGLFPTFHAVLLSFADGPNLKCHAASGKQSSECGQFVPGSTNTSNSDDES